MFIPFFMLIGTYILNFIPFEKIHLISIIIGSLWYKFTKRKFFIRKNLIMIENIIDENKVRNTFINFIYVYLTLLKLPNMKKEDFLRIFPQDTEEKHLKEIEKDKGAILVGAHIGAWELAGPLLAALGYKIISVAESKGPGEKFFRFYLRYRNKFGAKIIKLETKDITEKLLDYYKNGYLIGLISDRDISKTGRIVQFLNGKISFPSGAAILSYRLKSKILIGFIIVEELKFKILTYPILKTENMKLEELFTKIKEFIEDAVKKYPDNWFVFEDIWR